MREVETDNTVIWPSWCYNTGENRLETAAEPLKSRPLTKSSVGNKSKKKRRPIVVTAEKRMNGLGSAAACENRSPTTFANAYVSGATTTAAASAVVTANATGASTTAAAVAAAVKMEVKTERLSPASAITDNNSSGSGSNTPSSSYPETPPGSGNHNDRIPSPSLSPAALLPHSKMMDQPLARNYSDIMRSLAAKYNNSNPNDYFNSSKNGLTGTFNDPRFSSFKSNPFAGLVAPLTSGSSSPPSALNSSCHLIGSSANTKDSSDVDMPSPLFAGFGLNSFAPCATVPPVNLPLFSPLGDMNSTQALLNMVRTASSNAHLENYMKGSTSTKRPSELVNNPLDLSSNTPLPPTSKKVKRQSSSMNVNESFASGYENTGVIVPTITAPKSKTADRTCGKRADSVSPKPGKAVPISQPTATDRPATCLSICTTSPDRRCGSPSREENVENVSHWSIDDVYNFVSSIDVCVEYAEKFREQSIDGVSLPLLTEEHLRTTINMKLGPALKFRALLAQKIGHCTVCMHCLHCHNNGNSNNARLEGSVNSGHVPTTTTTTTTSITNNGSPSTATAIVVRPNSTGN